MTNTLQVRNIPYNTDTSGRERAKASISVLFLFSLPSTVELKTAEQQDRPQQQILTMSDDEDDDSVSIESNPFAREYLTEERLEYYRRIHEENPHPVYREPPLPANWDLLVKSLRSTKPRIRRMLAGLEQPQPGHGRRRRPDGTVRSLRLEAQSNKDIAQISAMSGDDSVSIESNPFERECLTEERLEYYRKIHETNPMYRGPSVPAHWNQPVRSSSPELPSQRILAGLEQLQGHDPRRSPDGTVRSLRLEVQNKKDVAQPATRPPAKPARPRRLPKANAPAPKPSRTGRVQKKASSTRRRKAK